MEGSFGSLLPRRGHTSTKSQKQKLTDKQLPLLKKPPQILSSVKGMVHRKTKSLSNVRGRKSGPRNARENPVHVPHRSRSLGHTFEQPTFQKKGSTPGMDDYLTLAQLEDVWQTQGHTLGAPDLPQTASEYIYTYVEPVELGTSTKHQVPLDPPVVPDDESVTSERAGADIDINVSHRLPAAKSATDLGRDRATTSTEYDRRPQPGPTGSTSAALNLLKPPSPLPLRVHSRPTTPTISKSLSPSPLRVQSRPTTPIVPSGHEQKRKQILLSTSDEPAETRPLTARSTTVQTDSRGSTNAPSPSRSPARLGRTARNEVISGIVHPALRPIPYFEPQQASAPSCRIIANGVVPHQHAALRARV